MTFINVGYSEDGSNAIEVIETDVKPRDSKKLTDIIEEGYMTREVDKTEVSEIIYIPPTDPDTIQNLFRSWLTMSGHTAYVMGVAKANGAATMSDREAYDYLHRNLFPYRDITAITITYQGKQSETGRYGVHVYAKDVV